MGTRRYKVRFHLAQGVNFMKWQIKDTADGHVSYYYPSKASLRLKNCKLVNRPTTAQRIHDGAHKTVCAWIECESVEAEIPKRVTKGFKLSYNPRVKPNWELQNQDSMWHGENIDGKEFGEILSSNRSLYSV